MAGRELFRRPLRQVADRDDADDLAAIDHRQVPDVEGHHPVGRLADVRLRPDRLEVSTRHPLCDLHGSRIPTGGDEIHHVALGQDPAQLVALLEDDDRRDPMGAHDLGHIGERILGFGRLHVRPHDVADQHRATSWPLGNASLHAGTGRPAVG